MIEKEYVVDVDIKFTQALQASSKEEAIEITKELFKEEFNIDLEDSEITSVKEF